MESLKEQLNKDKIASKEVEEELALIQGQYSSLKNSYENMLRREQKSEEAIQELKVEGDELKRQLLDLEEQLKQNTALVQERTKTLEEAENRELEWQIRCETAEEQYNALREAETVLRQQLDDWQQQCAAAGDTANSLAEEKSSLALERDELAGQLEEIGGQFELISHEYRLMQTEREMERERIQKIQEEHAKLKEEYAKLQMEYNEWIELIEQDQT
ncbi:Chromosome partition protein Smc [compost metagenome]